MTRAARRTCLLPLVLCLTTALAAGCEKTESWTGLRAVIRFDPGLDIAQFAITVSVDGSEVITGVRRPALPDGVLTSGDESLVLRFDHDQAGSSVRLLVDGLDANGQVVAIGEVTVPLERRRLVPVLVQLAPSVGCGDGVVEGPEQCDDGGNAPGDGCSAVCRVEDGWACTGEPSVCAPVCGDGRLSGAEECDDGDADDGDGCSALCVVEFGWQCDNTSGISVCIEDVTPCTKDDECHGAALCNLATETCVEPEDQLWVNCDGACPGMGTEADPFCALGDAMAAADPGQLVRLQGATCAGPVTFATEGVHLVGVGRPNVVSATCPTLVVDGVSAWIRGVVVLDDGGGTGSGVAAINGAELHLFDSRIRRSSCSGVDCAGAHCELRRNLIRNNDGGVQIQGSDFILVNNIVANNGTNQSSFGGILIDAVGADPALVLNNTVADNLGQGGSNALGGVHCTSNATVVNTILWNNAGHEVDGSCAVRHSIVNEAGFAGVDGNLEDDPLLDGNWMLTAGSPAIDAGDDTTVTPPTVDIEGDVRPQGDGIDIGADEAG